jgi:uncharacterized protein (DUF2236 family)
VNPLKRAIVADITKQTGAHDEPHIFGGPPGDPGLIGPGSMSWRINGDIASVVLGGIGAIVMEILHPSVMAGVQDQSNYAEQPERRGKTTFGYVVTTTFANTNAATRLINVVKKMHSQVNGTRPDGVPYRALDPELIGWVHTCIPWAVMTAYERYNEPLTVPEKDQYLREQALIGRMSGAGEIPESVAELDFYVEDMRPKLAVTQQTLQFFEFLMTMPFGVPLPGPLSRPMHRFQVEAGMSLMPEWARRMSGFDSLALERKLMYSPSLASYARAIRWAFGTPAYRRLAEERAAQSDGVPNTSSSPIPMSVS